MKYYAIWQAIVRIDAALSQNIRLELRLGLPDAESAKHNFLLWEGTQGHSLTWLIATKSLST